MKQFKFSDIDLSDPFFNSLKEDYPEFSEWYTRKAKSGAKAFIQKDVNGFLQAFLYMKPENGAVDDVNPPMIAANRLKVGTFKVDAHNTKLGEYFIKKIMTSALYIDAKEIYVTVFEKHEGLIKLLQRYGFVESGTKGEGKDPELVFVKTMALNFYDLLKDYPFVSSRGKRKFVLSVRPEYHTKLFPDSILNNEQRDRRELVKDVKYTNSIHKIYICKMEGVDKLQKGDILLIYRTSDGKGAARFRSVISSICIVEEIKKVSEFASADEFVTYSNAYSIFDEAELRTWYDQEKTVAIKMTYNVAFDRRIVRGELIEKVGLSPTEYWGFFEITDEQFKDIISRGKINESIIVD